MGSIPANYKSVMCQAIRSSFPENKVYINSSGADLLQGDFAVLDGKICGVVDLDSLSGASISLTVDDKLEILTSNINASAVFGTQGDKVYFDETAKEFTSIAAGGLREVGFIITPKDGNDLIRFQMYNVVESSVPATAVVTSALTLLTGNNTVTVTLTGGTFAPDVLLTDLTFAGTDAAALVAGSLVRTSDTVVTITIATGNTGTNNVITVTSGAQDLQAASVAAVASTV